MEWIDIAKNIVIDRLDPINDLNNSTATLLNVINNIPPDGKTVYFYISVKNGSLDDMQIGSDESLIKKDAEFIVTGNYDTFVQIFKGELSTFIALIKNRIDIKGDKKKAIGFVKPIDRLTSVLREIDTEY